MAYPPAWSTRFLIGRTYSAGSISISYVVPAGRVAVIRTITAVKQALATASVGVAEVLPTGSANSYPIWIAAMPSTTALQSVSLEGRVVLNAGDTLTLIRSGAASDIYWSVSGYLLTAL